MEATLTTRAGALLLETRSRTTVENLSFSIALLARQGLLGSVRTVHLVLCPWHMCRVLHFAGVAFSPRSPSRLAPRGKLYRIDLGILGRVSEARHRRSSTREASSSP
jgi:uncharacterized SAM-binding protein YcdF (DUF218 family)